MSKAGRQFVAAKVAEVKQQLGFWQEEGKSTKLGKTREVAAKLESKDVVYQLKMHHASADDDKMLFDSNLAFSTNILDANVAAIGYMLDGWFAVSDLKRLAALQKMTEEYLASETLPNLADLHKYRQGLADYIQKQSCGIGECIRLVKLKRLDPLKPVWKWVFMKTVPMQDADGAMSTE